MYLIAMYTVFHNFKNSCRLFGIVSLCFLCMACPGEENCDDRGASALVDGLISLSPEQEVYEVGDELTLSLNLPSSNTYLGDEVDFYMETQDKSPLLVFHFEELFSENEVLINKGKKGDSSNRYYMVYNQEIGIYELIINITLEKNRSYAFLADASIYVIGREDCNRYRLDTSIVWQGIPWVEFRVEE
ncbi:hypothetical protein FVB9532_03150 [Mesonia oceanica]|uniref:Uncharacterized protein n=1 Tax=Mesonia oceanica TaxID=2687242 RepID=A0AC61YBJ3_9FLAO|nr:hypothetical protein FVB9532_03150 [Mesonia oceanica]